MPALTSLKLEGMHSPFGGLFTGLTGLTSLELEQLRGVYDLWRVGSLSRLTELSIKDVYEDSSTGEETDVAPLAQLVRLKSLSVFAYKPVGFENLNRTTSLRSLKIDSFASVDLRHLSGLTQLSTLHVAKVCDHLESIVGLSALTDLAITSFCSLDVQPLAGLSRLETLKLVGDEIDGGFVGLENLAALAKLPHLASLELDGFRDSRLSTALGAFSDRTTIKIGRVRESW